VVGRSRPITVVISCGSVVRGLCIRGYQSVTLKIRSLPFGRLWSDWELIGREALRSLVQLAEQTIVFCRSSGGH